MRRGVVAFVLAAVLLVASVPGAAQSAEPTDRFLVALAVDGSATVSVTTTFDLTSDAERAAFEDLADDAEARAEATERFVSRMRTIANATEDAAGREMAVTDGAMELETTADEETGVVTLSVTWAGLAAVEGETLRLTEPFASEFTPDSRFVVRAPEGYAIDAVSPGPDDRDDAEVAWEAGTSLDGFELVAAPAPTPTATPSPTPSPTAVPTTETPEPEPTASGGQPGFGLLAGLAGVGLAWLLARRRA